MKTWQIWNQESGVYLGVYKGKNKQSALNSMAREAGYKNYVECCEETQTTFEQSSLVVEEINTMDKKGGLK